MPIGLLKIVVVSTAIVSWFLTLAEAHSMCRCWRREMEDLRFVAFKAIPIWEGKISTRSCSNIVSAKLENAGRRNANGQLL